jgi:type VI secretion system FHA domain protein
MRLRLVIETAPRPQAVTETVFEGGRLSIGRSDEADWQLDDPEMFVSRRHCVLSEEDGRVMVTDASSGGLFIDNAANPVGAGNAVPLEPGMRLRLGDFTLRVEPASAAPAQAGGGMKAPARVQSGGFDFGPPEEVAPPPERPASLPDPFGLRRDGGETLSWETEDPKPPRPLDQADPFELDLRGSARSAPRGEDAASDVARRDDVASGVARLDDAASGVARRDDATPRQRERPGRGYFFDEDATASRGSEPVSEPEPEQAPPRRSDLFADLAAGLVPPVAEVEAPKEPDEDAPPILSPDFSFGPPPKPEPEPEPERAPEPPVAAGAQLGTPPPEGSAAGPPQPPEAGAPPAPSGQGDRLEALFRGMGLDPAGREILSEAEIERIGAAMRAMVEGVMLLLRTRAKERQKVRVAQTIIASHDVNPLKFLATSEEALEALIRPRGRGYLAPEPALAEAFRDLTDHQLRTWSALQTALRRMVDKFDPAEISREMEDVGRLESLIAGGRSAKLWQLYEERYREIARAAEEQFLGEVGADFREAYENQRRD